MGDGRWFHSGAHPAVSTQRGDVLDHRLEPHDANQLELKLGYLIKPGKRKVRYQVETFLFFPRTLGIDRNSYKASHFFADTAAFLRFKTPSVRLATLAECGETAPWFARVFEGLSACTFGNRSAEPVLLRHLKLLGCIYRSTLRDTTAQLLELIDDLRGFTDERRRLVSASRVSTALTNFAEHLQQALARLRTLEAHCVHGRVGKNVHATWRAVDEYTSLVGESLCTDLVAELDRLLVDHRTLGPILQGNRELLATMAIDAFTYRRQHSYRSYVTRGAENEGFPHWRRVLKRITFSALYLDVRHAEVGRLANNLVAMLAAALAMLFAVLIGMWAQLEWDIFSGTFVFVMVCSYMIKDRIKDWGKRYFGRRAARFHPDAASEIRTLDGRVIGRCRESFWLTRPNGLSQTIQKVRYGDRRLIGDGHPETVVRYAKEVTLYPDSLRQDLEGLEGLNDIIRFNFSRLRDRMDAPSEDYRLVDPKTRKLVVVPCTRVYHVNLVLRMTIGRGHKRSTRTERVRVVMDQRGIKRVEFPESGEAPREGALWSLEHKRLVSSQDGMT